MVHNILLLKWDPISVASVPEAADEYDPYIPTIISMLESEASKEIIADYLSKITNEYMALPQKHHKDLYIASQIKEAYKADKLFLLSSKKDQPEMVSREQLTFEAAKYIFGRSNIDKMREIINSLVKNGVYYDTFYDVLYPDNYVIDVIGPAFERSLRSLGITIPDYEGSVWIIIHYYLQRIVSGETDPYEGLYELMLEVYWDYDFYSKTNNYLGDSHGIQDLVGLYWGYDDFMERSAEVSLNGKYGDEAVEELKKEIFAEAQKWVFDFKKKQQQ